MSLLEDVLASPIPVLVDFWAPWCGPCRAMAPALDELTRTYAGKVRVVKVDTTVDPDTAARFGVRGMPTLSVFVAGRHVDQILGFQSRAKLTALFERLAQSPVAQVR